MKKSFYYVISDACVETKARECVNVCPVDCIYDIRDPKLNMQFGSNKPKQVNDKVPYPYETLSLTEIPDIKLDWGILVIDPDACTKCGLCEVACPVKAVKRLDSLSDSPFFEQIKLLGRLPDREKLNAKNFVNQF